MALLNDQLPINGDKMVLIEKNPSDPRILQTSTLFYDQARDAMFDLMTAMMKEGKLEHLLIPAYIGWSPKEGSGIYDPIVKLAHSGLTHSFYRIDSLLNIDIEDLSEQIQQNLSRNQALLVVNYFGFYDAQVLKIIQIAHEAGVTVIEDNAHGLYTHLRSGGIGADATFFSLHKMLPFRSGGSLVVNNNALSALPLNGLTNDKTNYKPWLYDLGMIARVRRENYNYLLKIIHTKDHSDLFDILYDDLPLEIVPQSLPILIRRGNRFAIYERMNEAGFGVVSLYHTLIEPIQNPRFSDSLSLSGRILNLPVHQDVDTALYEEMIDMLIQCCLET